MRILIFLLFITIASCATTNSVNNNLNQNQVKHQQYTESKHPI